MATPIIPAAELLYEAEIEFTHTVEYGVCIEALSSGTIQTPLEGARFDQSFQGTLQGAKLRGKISGTDYLYVRADGHFQLHIHAHIDTEDGHKISFSSQGVSAREGSRPETQLRAAVSLFSASPRYRWLNKLQVWAVGTLDLATGRAYIRAYTV